MGICFSCLGLGSDDSDLNERSSLLGNSHLYSNEDLHEDILKQQQRQNELNVIVNDLSENLIDVSTFRSKTAADDSLTNKNTISSQNTDLFITANGLQRQDSSTTQSPELGNPESGSSDVEKAFPYLWPLSKKAELLKNIEAAPTEFEVKPPSEALYVLF